MEINCSEIRKSARKSLEGKWKVIILSTLMYNLLSILLNIIKKPTYSQPGYVFILPIIYTSLFVFGYTKIVLDIAKDEDVEFLEIFAGCKRFLKALGMIILIKIYTMLWSLLFIIPGIIATFKYSMTFFVWIDNPDIGINEAISKSAEITKGHKFDIFILGLSFIGWSILVATPTWALIFWNITQHGSTFMQAVFSAMGNKPVVIISLIAGLCVNAYKEVSMGKLYNKLVGGEEKNYK